MTAKRHCSICHLPVHDARAHKKNPSRKSVPRAFKRWLAAGKPNIRGRRPARRNLDAFVADGVVHPIRGSKGYNDWLLNKLPPKLRREYDAEMRSAADEWNEDAGRDWRSEVKAAVKDVSPYGIAPHAGRHEHTEYRLDVPLHLKNRRGQPADWVADAIKAKFPWLGIETEDDLLQALAA